MIKEFIYLELYLGMELLNCILTYVVIFQINVTQKKKSWLMSLLILNMIHGIIFICAGLYNAMPVSQFSMIVIPCFLLEKREKKAFLLYPVVSIGASIFAVAVTYIIAMFLNISEHYFVLGTWRELVCEPIPSIFLLMVYFYRKCKKIHPIQVDLGVSQYLLFYVVMACSYIMIACMQVASEGNLTIQQNNLCGFAISVVCIALVIFSIWQGIVTYREREYREQNKIYEEYMKMQEEHFQEIQQQDESMRRFRHDMNAHITALKSMCDNKTNEELKEYLNHMVENSAIYQVKEYTGNKTLDAVIRQLSEEAIQKQIQISVHPCAITLKNISIYDFCSIVYNLMKNAIEECEKIEAENERLIEIAFVQYNHQILLLVKNRVANPVVIENNTLHTTKKDKINHGLGSGNVEMAVKKYNGSVEYRCENGWFFAEIYV